MLVEAPQIREIVDPSPLVTVALHRLLLAILHRNFGPEGAGEWQALWKASKWDAEILATYFQGWRHRFDLFDQRQPFYQTADIDFSLEVPVSKLTHELASGNNPTLFDHCADDVPKALSPAQAARYLVAHQSFAVGGLITRLPGEGASAKAAPLTKAAVVLVRGKNLFQTLMLNLHRCSPKDEEPFKAEVDDSLAWERAEETRAEDRYPKGYLDLLTWQSRRIRLHPEQDVDGRWVVKHVVIMKGNQFSDGLDHHSSETMVAFGRVEKPAKGQAPWPPVTFQEKRALWRDSLSLFQSVEEKQARPKTLDWLNDLVSEGVLARSQTLQMDMLGLSTDRAKVNFWRHEHLPLPLAYLDNDDLLSKLRVALDIAENAGKALWGSARFLCKLLSLPNWDQLNERERQQQERARKKDIKNMTDNLAPERAYWPRLEAPFKLLLVNLPQDKDDFGEYGSRKLPKWATTVRCTAWQAFDGATRSLDTSARTLKAVTLARREFSRRLSNVLADYLKTKEGGADESTQ